MRRPFDIANDQWQPRSAPMSANVLAPLLTVLTHHQPYAYDYSRLRFRCLQSVYKPSERTCVKRAIFAQSHLPLPLLFRVPSRLLPALLISLLSLSDFECFTARRADSRSKPTSFLPSCLPSDFDRFTEPPCQLAFEIDFISRPLSYLLGFAHLSQHWKSLDSCINFSNSFISFPCFSLPWKSTLPISRLLEIAGSEEHPGTESGPPAAEIRVHLTMGQTRSRDASQTLPQ